MRKTLMYFAVISLFLYSLFPTLNIKSVFAQKITPKSSPTPTPKPSAESDEIDTIEKIKDLVASKVAELNLVEKRGILGTVRDVNSTQITIEDHNKQPRIIDIDELTKFESASDKDSFGISDIKEKDILSFVGLYNKDSKRLLARFISKAASVPVNIQGVVSETDPSEFTVTLFTQDGIKKTVDIQSSTKTSSYDEESVKSGFSKIKAGQRIIVIGFEDAKEKDRINASRVIHFISLAPSREMLKQKELGVEEIQVSTGSAGKIAPIVR